MLVWMSGAPPCKGGPEHGSAHRSTWSPVRTPTSYATPSRTALHIYLRRPAGGLRSHPRGSQQGQISGQIQRFILRLAGYKILVGTRPSSRR